MNAFRWVLATIFATFVLLVIGGTVNPTGSSLACPDWPTCYGSFFPEMIGGVRFEHTHRVVATLVGLMTVLSALFISLERKEDRGLRRLGLAAIALVVLQGLLGGITVLLQLSMLVSAAHLALSMFFFCFLIYIAFRLAERDKAPTEKVVPPNGRALTIVGLGMATVYAQILLGAIVRHTNSGRICGTDFPWCLGEAWPQWGPGQLHMMHRYFAYLTAVVVFYAALVGWKEAKRLQRPLARSASAAAPILMIVQLLLGIWTVLSFIGLVPVTAHLAVGALLLASFLVTYLDLSATRSAVGRPGGAGDRVDSTVGSPATGDA